MITVRGEAPGDVPAVRRVHEEAFGQPGEARLIERLRARGGIALSLVAEVDDRVVGHVLYSPVRLDPDTADLVGVGLGPMAVQPRFQRQGVGAALIAAGTVVLRARGCPFIVVLGHPEYYPRFGFVAASRYGVRCEWRVPEEAFMMLPLDASRAAAMSGLARYREEFAAVAPEDER